MRMMRMSQFEQHSKHPWKKHILMAHKKCCVVNLWTKSRDQIKTNRPTRVGEMAVNHHLPPENWPLPISLPYIPPQAIPYKWVPMWNWRPRPRTHGFCKTVQPTHSKQHACGHLGLTSGRSCGDPSMNLNHCPVHQEHPPPNLTWPYRHLNVELEKEIKTKQRKGETNTNLNRSGIQ